MDLTKFIELLSTTPNWFKWTVGVWILGGAILFIRFLNFPTQSKQIPEIQQNAQASIKIKDQSNAPPSIQGAAELTMETYFNKLKEYRDRFLEKAEFLKSVTGKTVKWKGYVDQVTERDSGLSLIMKSDLQGSKSIFVKLPPESRVKAFSLQTDDLIQVTGRLETSTPNMPDIDATELLLLKPRSGKG